MLTLPYPRSLFVRKPTRVQSLLTFFLATLLCTNSYAEKMETIAVSASRIPQTLAASTASLSVIDAADLELIGSIHISEALARVPGVWISRGNGQEHLTAIRSPVLTGAGSCGAFTIAEDGVAVRATGFCNVNQLFDINTEQAQQVEVLRGPGTVLYGSDALHGVINVLSNPSPQQQQSTITLEAGENDYGRIKLSHGDQLGQHGYRISFNGASDGGYKDDSGYDQQKFSARHDYSGATVNLKTLLSLSNLNQETAGYVEGKDAYKDDDLKQENGDPDAFRDSQSARLQTRIEMPLANGNTFIATPYIRWSEMDFLMHFLPGTPLEENGQQSIGVQTSYHRTVSEQLTLTHGFDAEFTDAFLKQSQDGGFSSFPSGKQYDYHVDAQLLAGFLNADFQLFPATIVSAGTRYEYLEYDYDNKMLTGNTDENGNSCTPNPCRYTRPADSKDDFENWSFNASANHELNDNNNAILRLTHAFRAPQATEMYRLQNGQLAANLDSEQLNSIELGYRYNANTISLQLTSFYMEKSNVIFQSSDRVNLDDGKTKHYGLEYDLFWQLSDSWDINLAGTFARHEYTNNVTPFGSSSSINIKGNDIDTAPRRNSSLQLGWTPTDSTRVELEWLSMGRYYTDIDNLHSYEGHDLLNLRLRQQINKSVSVGLRVTNLTDTDYAERADYSGFGGDRYFIGEPRSFYGDISLLF